MGSKNLERHPGMNWLIYMITDRIPGEWLSFRKALKQYTSAGKPLKKPKMGAEVLYTWALQSGFLPNGYFTV
jgi:hypothetical protein